MQVRLWLTRALTWDTLNMPWFGGLDGD